ncbi:hypothetical protein [Armatimonas sp.]|uniref:hypothetical protein n=1 Tax=Armatimonas sp. TaxID=1872638 RepID=UPI0037508651
MLLAPPPAMVLLTQTQEKLSLAKIELIHLEPTAFILLLDTPELMYLFAEFDLIRTLKLGKTHLTLRPVDLSNILASDADHTIIIQGTPKALGEVRTLLALLDVEPKSVQLTMRFLQKGKPEIHPVISTFSNSKGRIAIGCTTDQQSVTVIPHLNRDGKTVAVAAQVNKEKWQVQTLKLGVETKFVFPNNQELFVTATLPEPRREGHRL